MTVETINQYAHLSTDKLIEFMQSYLDDIRERVETDDVEDEAYRVLWIAQELVDRATITDLDDEE